MKSLRRLSLWALAGAVLSLAFTGCRTRTPMETVIAELDPAAPILLRGDPKPILGKLDRRLDEWGVQLIRESRSGEEPMRRLSVLAGARLALNLLFDAEDVAFGAASTPLEPVDGAPLYRNDLLLCRTPGASDGLLWRLFGTADRDLAEDLRAIPADALLAADFTLDAAAAETVVARLLAPLIGPAPDPDRTAALAAAITGPYALLVLPVEAEGVGLVGVIPDRGGLLYAALAATLPANERGEPELADHTGYFCHDGDETIFFSSPATADAFAADTARLIDDPNMAPLFAGLPDAGTGFLYLSDEPLPADRLSDLPPRTLLILTAEDTGLRARANAAWNWLDLTAALLIPAEAPEMNAEALLDRLKNDRNDLLENLDTAACRAQLLRLRDALFAYRDRHGAFPAPEGIAGIRLLIAEGLPAEALLCPAATADRPAEGKEITADNCSYIFFGAPGESDGDAAPAPLVMDWPKNHLDRFGVLFTDGEIRFFALPAPRSARRAVSVLQSRFRYPEPEFRRLLRIADELDRENP